MEIKSDRQTDKQADRQKESEGMREREIKHENTVRETNLVTILLETE